MLREIFDNYEQAQECPFRNVLDKVGDKWTFLIFVMLEDGPKRFNEIMRLIGDISPRVLSRKLRELERDGFLSRTVYSASPPKVEYGLTELGQALLEPVTRLLNWSLATGDEVKRAREAFDRSNAKRSNLAVTS